MHRQTRIALAIVILLIATWLVLQGTAPQTAASPAEPAAAKVAEQAPTTPEQVTCNSCSDCSDKLASGLTSDGFLMLGAGETVVGQTDRFEPSGHGSALYTPKMGQATTRKSIESVLRPAAATG